MSSRYEPPSDRIVLTWPVVNTYSGRPGHVTYSLTATRNASFQDVATLLPPVSWSSPTPTATQVPLASGSRDDCDSYLLGDSYQQNFTNSYLTSNCYLAAEVMGVTLLDLETWNPGKIHICLGTAYELGTNGY